MSYVNNIIRFSLCYILASIYYYMNYFNIHTVYVHTLFSLKK